MKFCFRKIGLTIISKSLWMMCCTLQINIYHTQLIETFYNLVKCGLHAIHERVLELV